MSLKERVAAIKLLIETKFNNVIKRLSPSTVGTPSGTSHTTVLPLVPTSTKNLIGKEIEGEQVRKEGNLLDS